GDGDEAPTVDITNFTAGHLPYNSTPKIATFITSSNTTCAIAATATVTPPAASVSWEVTVPNDWSASGGTGTSFSQTATVPRHPDGGRPSGMKITLKATATHQNKTASATASATQTGTDRIRNMYIDHIIKIPYRSEFAGTNISLKSKVTQGHSKIQTAYSEWAGSPQSLPIESGYRNPEHNQDVRGKLKSVHQYGWAIDISPIPDNKEPGKQDDSDYIANYALEHADAKYVEQYPNKNYNEVHIHWENYGTLPNVTNP
ncbi:MAG TPA: hypothetical protein ENH97_03230, partial [bacterium]|nr:hypothetical protein [bacterium]